MDRPSLTVTIITLNEEGNLPRAIQSVQWAEEILVVDSGSTDSTVDVAKKLGAKVIYNAWPGYGKQKNFAQSKATYNWVLNIDADEEVPPSLAQEIQKALESVGKNELTAKGFYFPRKTFYLGKWIKHGGWYPNFLTRLADRRHASWTEPHVHEALSVQGDVIELKNSLHHYSFRTIQEQILTNVKFSYLGFQDLKHTGRTANLLQLLFKPVGKFIETYLLKGGVRDGLPGFIISVNAAYSMFMKYAYLIENRIREENANSDH